jgi:hypothetical protein
VIYENVQCQSEAIILLCCCGTTSTQAGNTRKRWVHRISISITIKGACSVFHHPIALLARPPFQADWAVDPRQLWLGRSCITGDYVCKLQRPPAAAAAPPVHLLLLRTLLLDQERNQDFTIGGKTLGIYKMIL